MNKSLCKKNLENLDRNETVKFGLCTLSPAEVELFDCAGENCAVVCKDMDCN